MLFVREGELVVAGDKLARGDLALLERAGSQFNVQALADASVLLMGGEPIAEPIVASGPFVMNTEQEIRRAIMDYHSGRMGML
jgi:hypothetical protein